MSPLIMNRRTMLGGTAAAATLLDWGLGPRPSQAAARQTGAARQAGAARFSVSGRYQPLTAGIVHFFSYGQSLSNGYKGFPVLSTSQPYDDLMIGQAVRAVNNADKPPVSTSWVPQGPANGDGTYPFEPLVSTVQTGSGETPAEGAMNFLRRAWLAAGGSPATRFVVTACGIGGKAITYLSQYPGEACPFDRLIDAANAVRNSAIAQGLSYQVGGMIWTQGEQDVMLGTTYAAYLASLKQLQADFLTYVVQGVAGQPAGTAVPWFCHQPNQRGRQTIDVAQALLDWANTADSDLYLAAPVYMYPDPNAPHLTANGYRWHGNQLGKAMAQVLIAGRPWAPLQLASAIATGTSLRLKFSGAVGALRTGTTCTGYTVTSFPELGFLVRDQVGLVPLSAAKLSDTAVTLTLGRPLSGAASCQAGYNAVDGYNCGTNVCDSDATLADDVYVYQAGVQNKGENIRQWNGAPLVGQPYPLQNYCAVGAIGIT